VSSFLDTNILVYAFDVGDPRKQQQAQLLLVGDGPFVVSTQILQELFWTLTRKLRPALDDAEAVRAVRETAAYRVVQVGVPIILAATTRVQTASISFWDALVVEAALAAGATRLLTEDLQHGHVFDGTLRVENPFQ